MYLPHNFAFGMTPLPHTSFLDTTSTQGLICEVVSACRQSSRLSTIRDPRECFALDCSRQHVDRSRFQKHPKNSFVVLNRLQPISTLTRSEFLAISAYINHHPTSLLNKHRSPPPLYPHTISRPNGAFLSY